MKSRFPVQKFLPNQRSGFRQKAGDSNFKKCGGLPTAATIVILFFTGNLFAADVATEFSAANKLYAKGEFARAANAYEQVMKTGVQSAALLFNCGNAEFKSGHFGKAIAAYRQAAWLAPRDAEVRANLAFVRNQVEGATRRESRWQYWLGQLTLNEWTLLAATAFWLTFILLAAEQVARASRPFGEKMKYAGGSPVALKFRRAIGISICLAVVSGAALALEAAQHFSSQTAVIISPEAIARSGPFDEAQTAFTARDGAELAVRDRHGNWIQVADGSGKIGWLQTKQVEILPGA